MKKNTPKRAYGQVGITISNEAIGARLRAERERLGLTQTALGAAGGVSLRSQMRFEAGERSPDARYLAAVAAAGVNVGYVLLGRR